MNKDLSYRQIHLDFHTSPLIPGIGKDFDARRFAGTLKEARVGSINIFAKGHHGMCYYPTKVGRMHPNLEFDLLGSMLEACHAEGITAPIYICTGWEEEAAKNEAWLEVSMKGVLGGKEPFESGHYRWKKLCHNKEGYIEHIIELTDEIIDSYEVDGFWYDIVFQNDCVCADCQRSMREAGLDPKDPLDVKKNGSKVIEKFMKRIRDHVASRLPEATVYFNMHIDPDNGRLPEYSIEQKNQYQTHIEIESLPSGEWGYNHFPLFVNYLSTTGKQLIGMNGKFHKSWGDFGTLKNLEALRFECFRMTANGARCSIGDQMHPQGVLDPIVYENIGKVFKQVEQLEPYLKGARKLRDVAVLMSHDPLSESYRVDEGVLRMLTELQIPFDFINMQQSLEEYKLLILPDELSIPSWYESTIDSFLASGGKLLASCQAGRKEDGGYLVLDRLNLDFQGKNPYAPSYVHFEAESRFDSRFHYCFYSQGTLVKGKKEHSRHGSLYASYFNRSYDAFSSHCQSPVNKDHALEADCIISSDAISYCCYPLFKDYLTHGLQFCRELFSLMLEDLGYESPVATDLPVTSEVTLYHQKEQDRDIVHLLHYIPVRKSEELDVIDATIPLYDRKVTLKGSRRPSRVFSAFSAKELSFQFENELTIEVPRIEGYEVLVIEY